MYTQAEINKMTKPQLKAYIEDQGLLVMDVARELSSKVDKDLQEFYLVPGGYGFEEGYNIAAKTPKEAVEIYGNDYFDPFYADDDQELDVFLVTKVGTATTNQSFTYVPNA